MAEQTNAESLLVQQALARELAQARDLLMVLLKCLLSLYGDGFVVGAIHQQDVDVLARVNGLLRQAVDCISEQGGDKP
ncbi:hypothetical protein KC734_07680 [candidate division KSB1 bacterium]|nr:hypothetical protein [candidate division KSB1 bacterium]